VKAPTSSPATTGNSPPATTSSSSPAAATSSPTEAGSPSAVPGPAAPAPRVWVSGRVTITAGDSLDADSRTPYITDQDGFVGDFWVTATWDDPPGVFTGDKGDLAPTDTASWDGCRRASSFGLRMTIDQLKPKRSLCGITNEGRVAALVVLGAKADADGYVVSVSVQYTTWNSLE
jgi:hypothetical protein